MEQAAPHHGVGAPLRDEGVGLILGNHGFDQRHSVADALPHFQQGESFTISIDPKRGCAAVKHDFFQSRLSSEFPQLTPINRVLICTCKILSFVLIA